MLKLLTPEGLSLMLRKIKTVFATKTEVNAVSESLANQSTQIEESCVHKTGNETIAGTKTFSSTISGSVSGSSASCTGNTATATKATQDGSGNVITTTYATKAEIPSDYVGATSSVNGTHGLVPAAPSADKDKYLKGDGTWAELTLPSVYQGATTSANGIAGLVPAEASSEKDSFFTEDGD